MSTSKIICVTNRVLAGEDFFVRLEKIVSAGADAVILREKDLSEPDYEELAKRAAVVCGEYHVPLMLHTYINAAKRLDIRRIHLPLPMFLSMEEQEKQVFDVIGVSVHSAEEAAAAWERGASYLTAGHVFATDCKKGLEPRGLSFLDRICRTVDIPVYAIGGIKPENAKSCVQAGAAGVCLMSSLMRDEQPEKFLQELRKSF